MNWKALRGVPRGCRALRFSGFSGFSGFKVPIESRRRHFEATHTCSCPATRPHRRGSLLADVGAVGADDEIIALLGLFLHPMLPQLPREATGSLFSGTEIIRFVDSTPTSLVSFLRIYICICISVFHLLHLCDCNCDCNLQP